MDKRGGEEEAMTKRHTNKKQSQSASSRGRNLIPATATRFNASCGDLPFSDKSKSKSKKEKVRSLSAVAKALSMGCRVVSHPQKPTNKFNLPTKDCNAVDHVSVPRKIRSAVKKRGRESMFGDSEKVNHRMNGMESPQKDGIKKSKKQRTLGWSTRQVLTGPITKDEEEVVETLYALAGMFPDNASNVKSELDSESLPENSTVLQDQEESQSANVTVEASGATQDAGKKSLRGCKKFCSLNGTKVGQERTDFPERAKVSVAAPKTNLQVLPTMVKTENGRNVALHDSELSLEMGLHVPTQPRISYIGKQSDVECQTVGSVDCKQKQHLIKYQKETEEGSALWPGLSPIASAGITSVSYLQAKAQDWLNPAIGVSKQDLMESCSSGGKISEIISHKKSWKRCAAHVHISHLIRSLEVSKEGKVGKEHELCPQTTVVHQGSKYGVLMETHNLNWTRSGNIYATATRTVHSATTSNNSRETRNGILQHGLYHDISQAPPTPGVYGPQKQCFNFLSLSTGGSELKVNEGFNKGESKLEPYSKSQLPYFQSLQQQQQHGLMPIQQSLPPYASTFLDQLPVAGPQVRLQQQQQQTHYYGAPLRGTHYSSTLSYKQQNQSFWGVQVAAAQDVRAQYPNWQSGRYDSCSVASPGAQIILPHPPASLETTTIGSKLTSISDQLFTLASSRSRAASVCEESKGRFRSSSSSNPSLQLLCDERI